MLASTSGRGEFGVSATLRTVGNRAGEAVAEGLRESPSAPERAVCTEREGLASARRSGEVPMAA